jgi:hypothetical protein
LPVTDGSGSGSWIRILLLSFSAYFFLKVHLHHFLKIKSQKDVTKPEGRNQGFAYYFCLIEGSGSGSIQEAQKHTDPTDPDPQHQCLPVCKAVANTLALHKIIAKKAKISIFLVILNHRYVSCSSRVLIVKNFLSSVISMTKAKFLLN